MISTGGSFFSSWRMVRFLTTILPKSAERRKPPPFEPTHVEKAQLQKNERRLVHVLSDLRMVHLIHQSITPEKAGERYEAFILDYSLFTGFRRRPNVREMVPAEAQFITPATKKVID